MYDITHASSLPVTKQCPFNESQTVDRFCRKNFTYRAEWSEVDFSPCSPKTETTKKLLSLNQVGESLEGFSNQEQVSNSGKKRILQITRN